MAFSTTPSYSGPIAGGDKGTPNLMNAPFLQFGGTTALPAQGNRGIIQYDTKKLRLRYDDGSSIIGLDVVGRGVYADAAQSGKWVVPGWAFSAHSTGRSPQSFVKYIPILVAHKTTFHAIGVIADKAATTGQFLRLGIYTAKSTGNGLAPDQLVVDAGQISVNSTGNLVTTINETLDPGWYFLAQVSNVGAVAELQGMDSSQFISAPVSLYSGTTSIGPANKGGIVRTTAVLSSYATAGLPTTAEAPGIADQGVEYAAIRLRIA